MALEPELRRSTLAEAFPRRRLPAALVFFMGALRVYVLCSVVLVILTLLRAFHR